MSSVCINAINMYSKRRENLRRNQEMAVKEEIRTLMTYLGEGLALVSGAPSWRASWLNTSKLPITK